jgi:hypothetical protein
MDQAKEILKQAIKYRFWILVGISALLPLIAYFAAAGTLNAQTDSETKKIEGARDGVKSYVSGVQVNSQYSPLVDDRTKVLTKDVNAAWRKLYERQAPLLTWPPEVSEKFTTWGRKWPAGVDNAMVAETIGSYIETYPKYVEDVYKTVRPFDYENGDGVVVAPAKDALLRPSAFSLEALPSLGKVWAAQERLWVQRTVLDVIDKVNKDAKDWDSAIIKQVTGLEVASPGALDQKSATENVELEVAPDITAPGLAAAAAAATSGTTAPAANSSEAAYSRRNEGVPAGADMASMMAGRGMGGIGGAPAQASEDVYILKPKGQNQQYQVVPIYVSVYIEQTRIPDLIVGFQNSPMTVQVLDFEMKRPPSRVQKPAKGDIAPENFGGMMGMMGMRDEYVLGRGGFGTMMAGGQQGMMMGLGGGMDQYMRMGRGGGMMGGEPTKPARKGVDVRAEVKKREEEKKKSKKDEGNDDEEKAAEKKKEAPEPKITDPYFNIVEVHIYGQARFYNTPPAEQAQPGESVPSAGQAAGATDASAKTPAAEPGKDAGAKPGEAKPADSKNQVGQPATETSKDAEKSKDAETDQAKDETKSNDTAAKKDAAKDDAASKDEAPKGDASKASGAGEAPKADASKPDPKGDSSDTSKPKSDSAGAPAPKR